MEIAAAPGTGGREKTLGPTPKRNSRASAVQASPVVQEKIAEAAIEDENAVDSLICQAVGSDRLFIQIRHRTF